LRVANSEKFEVSRLGPVGGAEVAEFGGHVHEYETETNDAHLEFKKQAVQLLNTSGRPLAQIVRELGLPVWQLRDWKMRLQPQLDQQPETLEAMRLRLAQLERDNFQLRQQRDILKTTLGIVSTTRRIATKGRMIRIVDVDQPHIWFEHCTVCGGSFFDAGEFRDFPR
jgi:transposase-like protein